MKKRMPHYYEDFKCIGDKCPCNCCAAGWNIIVDKKSYQKYQELPGEIGERLRNAIGEREGREQGLLFLKLDENNTCPFLNENNLCEIVISLGEEYLCSTCRTYPRIITQVGGVYEWSLALSCPEVARILLTEEHPIKFLNCETEEHFAVETVKPIDHQLYQYLLNTRTLSIEIIQNRNVPLWKRLVLVIMMHDNIHKNINSANREEVIRNYSSDEYIRSLTGSLDEIHIDPSLKYNVLYFFVKQINYIYLYDYMQILSKYINGKAFSEVVSVYQEAEKEYEEYYQNKLYHYENFIVYHLFRYYMPSSDKQELYKNMVMMCLEYSFIKFLAVYKWLDNGKQLSLDEQCMILSSFSRNFEHNHQQYDKVYESLKENGMDSVAYMAVLLKGEF